MRKFPHVLVLSVYRYNVVPVCYQHIILLDLGYAGCAGIPFDGEWTRGPDTGSFGSPLWGVGVLCLFVPEGPPIWVTKVGCYIPHNVCR